MIHHDNKDSKTKTKYRGSSEINAAVDVAFNLSAQGKGESREASSLIVLRAVGCLSLNSTIKPDFDRGQFHVISDSNQPESVDAVQLLKNLIKRNTVSARRIWSSVRNRGTNLAKRRSQRFSTRARTSIGK